MRFLVDECTGPAIATWLRGRGFDVASVYDDARGASDDHVLGWAVREGRVLITNDKDFGERVYRVGHAHRGVIFLRLADERSANKIRVLRRLLASHAEHLEGRFVVATESHVRLRPPP